MGQQGEYEIEIDLDALRLQFANPDDAAGVYALTYTRIFPSGAQAIIFDDNHEFFACSSTRNFGSGFQDDDCSGTVSGSDYINDLYTARLTLENIPEVAP